MWTPSGNRKWPQLTFRTIDLQLKELCSASNLISSQLGSFQNHKRRGWLSPEETFNFGLREPENPVEPTEL
jgi:hypothetical protein